MESVQDFYERGIKFASIYGKISWKFCENGIKENLCEIFRKKEPILREKLDSVMRIFKNRFFFAEDLRVLQEI